MFLQGFTQGIVDSIILKDELNTQGRQFFLSNG